MKQFEFQPHSIQPRAKRICKEIWDIHKNDIVTHYEQRGLRDMMDWMKENKDFEAT